jgi:hypothetical protein
MEESTASDPRISDEPHQRSIPQGKWWSLPAFVKAIKEKFPDYQRPAGDYDSWFIKRASDGQFLRGFAYWDVVDGALIKYLIQTLHLLGRLHLAAPEEGKEVTAFFLLSSSPRKKRRKLSRKDNSILERKNICSANFSRTVRYQLARFCEWDDPKGDDYLLLASVRRIFEARH